MRVRLLIRGHVQGVGFRWWLQETAIRRNLDGWVRNLPDGSVEVELSGPDPDVKAVVSLCSEGPPSAAVSSVEQNILPDAENMERGFHIRR